MMMISRQELQPIIEEDLMPGYTASNIRYIEVVEEQNDDGKLVDRIVCFPSEEESIDDSEVLLEDLHRYKNYLDESKEEDEGVEVVEPSQENFIAQALMNSTILESILLYGCGGCSNPCTNGPCHPKGILKNPHNRSNSLNLSHSVSFSSLEISEFNMTLGNHPSATSGPPVMLDWNTELNKRIVDLDEYEQQRLPRRHKRELKLSYRDRKGILEKERGFSTAEVNEAWSEALKIRQQRHETLRRGLVMMTLDDVVESAQRKYRRVVESIGLV